MRQKTRQALALCAVGFVAFAVASQVRAMDGAVAQVPADGDAKVERHETALLVPGESLYVGSEKRFGILGSNVALSAMIPAEYVCACDCDPSELNEESCILELDATRNENCAPNNGVICSCSSEGVEATLANCKLKVLPKPKPGEAIPLQQNP